MEQKLANKKCYPSTDSKTFAEEGITFRERLIIALATNAAMIEYPRIEEKDDFEYNAKRIVIQADAIIVELEKEIK